MTEKQMIKLQFASNSVMWKVTAHGLISVTDSALNIHRGRKRAKQCRWESWKNRGGRQGGHWVQKRSWGGNMGGSETEKLISTLHCLLLPSVKDYPTAAEYRGAQHREEGGHRCGGKHTCTHTCAHTHLTSLGWNTPSLVSIGSHSRMCLQTLLSRHPSNMGPAAVNMSECKEKNLFSIGGLFL